MSRSAALVVAALVLGTALAPPGLCPCWLFRDPAALHPHVVEPGAGSHPHDDMLDLFGARSEGALTLSWIPVALSLAALAAAPLRNRSRSPGWDRAEWTPELVPPPPRRPT